MSLNQFIKYIHIKIIFIKIIENIELPKITLEIIEIFIKHLKSFTFQTLYLVK